MRIALNKELLTLGMDLGKVKAEIKRLQNIEEAWKVWQEKTDWVQRDSTTFELGLHRADVMHLRIDRLREENARLRKSLQTGDSNG